MPAATLRAKDLNFLMAFQHWPLVRDLRFAQKSGRYLRGARRRRPEVDWTEFQRIARQFKADDMGSFVERGYLFQLASDLPLDAQVVEVGDQVYANGEPIGYEVTVECSYNEELGGAVQKWYTDLIES